MENNPLMCSVILRVRGLLFFEILLNSNIYIKML